MTQDEIIEMARQVGDVSTDSRGRMDFSFDSYGLEAFAKLVAEKEREACAKIADEWVDAYPHPSRTIAEWIRKRGQA